jgi:thymidylate synthase
MKTIRARNVHQALPAAIELLLMEGHAYNSRNGDVIVHPEPVTTLYERPSEKVMFWPERDANPFLHFFEALWMLAGRNDIAYMTNLAASFINFSDDGKTQHGAYGRRWRSWFGGDQLLSVIGQLKADPESRRCVITMWDPASDLGRLQSKDLPCNTHIYPRINLDGALDITVLNRSNDIVWGCYGANAVHFAFLQEYLAAAIGVRVGRYWQVSNNWHAYPKTLEPVRVLSAWAPDPFAPNKMWAFDPYENGAVAPYPLMTTDQEHWDQDLQMFLEEPQAIGFRDRFFRRAALPMRAAHEAYKAKAYDAALDILDQCEALDWRLASQEWLHRRRAAAARKAAEKEQKDGQAAD